MVFEAANLAVVSVGMRVKYGKRLAPSGGRRCLPFLRSLAILRLLGLAVAALYAEAGIVAVVLLFVPLFASQYMFKLLVREKEHLAKQKELSDQYLEMNIGLAAAMVVLLDSKDEYTAQHSAAVAMYCRDIATALELPEEEAEALHLAGLLHDLGKVGVPDAVLRKTTVLDDEDWASIRRAPREGRRSALAPGRLPGGRRHRALPPRAAGRQWLPERRHGATSPSSARSSRWPTPTTR